MFCGFVLFSGNPHAKRPGSVEIYLPVQLFTGALCSCVELLESHRELCPLSNELIISSPFMPLFLLASCCCALLCVVVSRAVSLVAKGVTHNVLAFPDSAMAHALWFFSRSLSYPTIS